MADALGRGKSLKFSLKSWKIKKEPRPAQICTAYRCDHCEVDAGHYTCDNLLMEKRTLCDGISHCPKAEDENCYKPCCDGIELELDGKTHYLMKKQLTEEDTDVKDSYFQVRPKMIFKCPKIWDSEFIFDPKKPKGSMKIQFQKKKWLFYEGEEITGTLDHMSSCPNDMKSEPIRTSG